jgi:hypothetical protein
MNIISLQRVFLQTFKNTFYWRETGQKFSVTIVLFTTKLLELPLALEEHHKSFMPDLSSSSSDE